MLAGIANRMEAVREHCRQEGVHCLHITSQLLSHSPKLCAVGAAGDNSGHYSISTHTTVLQTESGQVRRQSMAQLTLINLHRHLRVQLLPRKDQAHGELQERPTLHSLKPTPTHRKSIQCPDPHRTSISTGESEQT
eukprot:5783667-Amphidinium_carterae.1